MSFLIKLHITLALLVLVLGLALDFVFETDINGFIVFLFGLLFVAISAIWFVF